MPDANDRSNDYDENAEAYVARRNSRVGVETVRVWAETLPRGAAVIDLGCGHGVPISNTLLEAGCLVHGVDALPRMVEAFQQRGRTFSPAARRGLGRAQARYRGCVVAGAC